MIDGNLSQNISFSNNYSADKIKNIGKILNMNILGKDSTVGLSQGELQRINIGRTLYKNDFAIILGDEIFSNIDKENEENIISFFEKNYKNKTILFVLHEEINYKFDMILHVDQGRVRKEI